MRDINREIEVVESIIGVLNKCIAVYEHAKQPQQIANCLEDISKCKKELEKLIQEKKMMLN
jgi:hypothetical protein